MTRQTLSPQISICSKFNVLMPLQQAKLAPYSRPSARVLVERKLTGIEAWSHSPQAVSAL